MTNIQFRQVRDQLGKTQKHMAQLMGVSLKAVHSYEQGWRRIPHHVERQLFFLLARALNPNLSDNAACWEIQDCPRARYENCPAWEFNAGDLCWFISGTRCSGKVHASWAEKMVGCRQCKVFLTQMKEMI